MVVVHVAVVMGFFSHETIIIVADIPAKKRRSKYFIKFGFSVVCASRLIV